MNAAILLLFFILRSVQVNGKSEGADRCPDVNIDLSRKPIVASSTCGDTSLTCEIDDDVNVTNVVDGNPTNHWISRPGVEAVNVTVDLVQVNCNYQHDDPMCEGHDIYF